ncbi:pilus assembly protein [Tardibacter chloracetimidivorans]|uniref:Pilus assembly protein n=1 Tax=Tardibacter chloracetimidivorans TaxID=1921510 RepID=A0A1L3ZZK2_9SPHN|nr:pilus assembly protein [Tardibacter chloracetimidivorans]
MTRHLTRLGRDEQGATAIEYGLIAALIVIAMVAGLAALGGQTTNMFNDLSEKIDNAIV